MHPCIFAKFYLGHEMIRGGSAGWIITKVSTRGATFPRYATPINYLGASWHQLSFERPTKQIQPLAHAMRRVGFHREMMFMGKYRHVSSRLHKLGCGKSGFDVSMTLEANYGTLVSIARDCLISMPYHQDTRVSQGSVLRLNGGRSGERPTVEG